MRGHCVRGHYLRSQSVRAGISFPARTVRGAMERPFLMTGADHVESPPRIPRYTSIYSCFCCRNPARRQVMHHFESCRPERSEGPSFNSPKSLTKRRCFTAFSMT